MPDARRARLCCNNHIPRHSEYAPADGSSRRFASGCGDNNWPKTVGFLAGWGFGFATLNAKPLYQNYEMHFMVTQGRRDRQTLRVNYPLANKKLPGGETIERPEHALAGAQPNPATQQIDFYIRSPQMNPRNRPDREVFLHFLGMEVTWK